MAIIKFERRGNPKRSMRIGRYSNMLKVIDVVHEINGGQISSYTLLKDDAEKFLYELSQGILAIPSELRLKNGMLREEFRLVVQYPDGSTGNHTSNVPGIALESDITGEIYDIPEELTIEVKRYDPF